MNATLHPGVILDLPEPFTFRVRLEDGREVAAIPSRFHFEHTPDDLERIQALRRGVPVTIRVSAEARASGWLVRVARTETDWRGCTEPATLLETVRGMATERKLRLFACVCCRQVEELIPPGPHRLLLDILESYAEGQATVAELKAALAAAASEERQLADAVEELEDDPVRGPEMGATAKAIWAVRIAASSAPGADFFESALDAARSCVEALGLRARAAAARLSPDTREGQGARAEEAAFRAQAELVRELFSDPFQPAVVAAQWRTPCVLQLAEALSANPDGAGFGELADALETAGCAEVALLHHCRESAAHARGCWALDLLCGRS